jgi:hypothetical protein
MMSLVPCSIPCNYQNCYPVRKMITHDPTSQQESPGVVGLRPTACVISDPDLFTAQRMS